LRAVPACLDVEQHPFAVPAGSLEAHVQAYDHLLGCALRTGLDGAREANPEAPEPALATAYDVSRDGRTYAFSLRRGVCSGHGSELTAHDVKWSWERALALGSHSARLARSLGMASPDAMRTAGNYDVRVHLDEPRLAFPAALAGPLLPVYDLETVKQHCPVGDPWGHQWLRSHAAGFGPYVAEVTAPGEEILLRGNDRWWRGPLRVHRVLLRAIAADAQRAGALRSGTVDVVGDLGAADLNRLAACPGLHLDGRQAWQPLALRIDPAFAPFSEPRVRAALSLALPYTDLPHPPHGAAQDLRRARSLLRDGGYGAGFRATLSLADGQPELATVARLIQQACMRLELKLVVELLSPVAFAARKGSRQLPLYVETCPQLSAAVSPGALDPLPQVEQVPLGTLPRQLAARFALDGVAHWPDGYARFADFRPSV
ncbi:MAG: ABC transporter substrate-binding protein, partial [Chloroflexota bacterium]